MKIGDPGYLNLVKANSYQEPKTKDEKKLKETSQQFEAIFVKMMLDSMEKTVDKKNNMFYGGQGEEIFQNMLNDERAKDISKSNSVGLAEMVYNQLSKSLIGEQKK